MPDQRIYIPPHRHARPRESHRQRLKRIRLQLLQECPKCLYCGCWLDEGTATIDHLHPLSKGGTSHIKNLVLACKKCNQAKGNHT